MADILVLQHVAPETPGLIGEVCAEHDHDLHTVRVHDDEPVPRKLNDAAALLVMGGPMGVYETEKYPHLDAELRLIEEALRTERPILGVCLGSQLLARALGAEVRPGDKKEIGWHSVQLTDAAPNDPLWAGIESPFPAFHWHGDVFEVPEGATRLARSDQTACQAFRYGERAYGILFHMEVTPGILAGMTEAFAGELEEEGLDGPALRRQSEAHLAGLQAVGRAVFGRWSQLIAKSTP